MLRLIGAAAAAMAAWAWPRFRRELDTSRARLEGRGTVVDTAGGPIEYAELGSGPPLLVVHGAGGGFDQGLLMAEPLALRGYRAIAMSRFGYLRTPVPQDAAPAAQADAHAALLDALGIERAAVLGISAGAPSALEFAIRHPDRCAGLVLLVPLAYRPGAVAESRGFRARMRGAVLDAMVGSDFAYWLVKSLAPDRLTAGILGTPPECVHLASPAERARVRRLADSILPVSARAAGLRNDARVAQSLTRPALERVRAPTLVASVEDDGYRTYAGASYYAGQIPGARFVGYPSGGHVWVGRHLAILAEIDRFLRQAMRAEAEAATRAALRAAERQVETARRVC